MGGTVRSVLQLRLLPALVGLRERIAASEERHQVTLSYITRRGKWYQISWKGSEEKSGGLILNIGVHLFDLILWLFGAARSVHVHLREADRASGFLELEKADVRWYLSTREGDLPEEVRAAGGYAHRHLSMDGEAIEFSPGFTDLHTRVYEDVLAGGGFGIDDARPSIDLAYRIRTGSIVPAMRQSQHPLLNR